jgi:hypothetical protein
VLFTRSSAPPADRRREHRERGSRLVAAYFVTQLAAGAGARFARAFDWSSQTKSVSAPPHHGGARSECYVDFLWVIRPSQMVATTGSGSSRPCQGLLRDSEAESSRF